MLASAYPVDGDTVGLWHFNEGSGSTADDAIGNNNDGTLKASQSGYRASTVRL